MHEAIEPSGVFKSPTAPTSLATLTQGARRLHISGQIPVDAHGNNVGPGDPAEQVRQVLANVVKLLDEAGATTSDVCRLTIYLLRREDLPAVMAERRKVFQEPYPATTVIIVAGLANPDWLVEIEGEAVF